MDNKNIKQLLIRELNQLTKCILFNFQHRWKQFKAEPKYLFSHIVNYNNLFNFHMLLIALYSHYLIITLLYYFHKSLQFSFVNIIMRCKNWFDLGKTRDFLPQRTFPRQVLGANDRRWRKEQEKRKTRKRWLP